MNLILVLLGTGILIYATVLSIVGYIPKKGRSLDCEGEEILATITNSNLRAERTISIRAVDGDGVKYKAKLRPTEAKMWIKGDKIRIVVSKDKKNYRILFHEYFKENEERMRAQALCFLEKKIKFNSIAAKLASYNKECLETLRASKADSQLIFIFATYMSMVNKYFVVALISAVLFAIWNMLVKLRMFHFIVPLVIIIVMFYSVSSLVKVCTLIYKKATR